MNKAIITIVCGFTMLLASIGAGFTGQAIWHIQHGTMAKTQILNSIK